MLEYINEPFYRYVILAIIIYHAYNKYFPEISTCTIIWLVLISILATWFVDILNDYYKESVLNQFLSSVDNNKPKKNKK